MNIMPLSVQFHVRGRLHVVRASYHIMTSYRVSIAEKTTEKCYLFVKCNGFLIIFMHIVVVQDTLFAFI